MAEIPKKTAIKDKKEKKSEHKIIDEKKNVEKQKIEDIQESNLLNPISWDNVKFSFPQPKIRFGKGVVDEIPKAILKLLDPMLMHLNKVQIENPVIMFVIGHESLRNSNKMQRIQIICKQNAFDTFVFSIGTGEANVKTVDEGVQLALEKKPHFVVGIGGGSVLDTAKAIAGIARNGGLAEDYFDGKPFESPGIPFIAVPTTAGTGSEITNNAVLIDSIRGFKRSIRGDKIISKYILLDPELSLNCPPEITASSGTDALVHAVESYISKNSHPLADLYALQAISLIAPNLRKVFENGQDLAARSEMLLGSFFAGVAFSNVGLGIVHGLAHPIGYKYGIHHGKICGVLLPWVIEYNAEYRADKYAFLAKKFDKMLDLFNKYEPEASDLENTHRFAAMIKEILSQVQIPLRLRELGVKKEDFDWIISNAKGGSVNANPRSVDPDSLKKLLETAW